MNCQNMTLDDRINVAIFRPLQGLYVALLNEKEKTAFEDLCEKGLAERSHGLLGLKALAKVHLLAY